MTKELKDNSAMFWAWAELSWSNLGSDLLSTALATMCNELWAEPAKLRRRPSASQQVGWKQQAQHLHFPKPSSARSALTTSAVETDLAAKFKCGIFQTAGKSDGLVMKSWKRLGLEQPSQAAMPEAIILSPWCAQAKKNASIQKIFISMFSKKREEK